MNNPIVTRLLKNRSSQRLKESMSLFEADDDEEYAESEDEVVDDTPDEGEDTSEFDTDIEDDSTAPEQGSPDDPIPGSGGGSLPSFSKGEESEGEDTPEEDINPEKEVETEYYENPLDNQYAVKFTLGSEVSLSFEGDTQHSREGVVDGYDPEGFYRVRWADGTTTNGLTDIAIKELVSNVTECVCGHTHFINEGKHIVCDRCGRRIREGATLLSADKSRPKGKRLIRSEAHPISTALAESKSDSGYAIRYTYEGDSLSPYESTMLVIASTEDEAKDIASKNFPDAWNFRVDDTVGEGGYIASIGEWKATHPNSNYSVFENKPQRPLLKEAIKKALLGSKINEDYDEEYDEEESNVFDRLKKELDNEFWTRQNEIVDDIEELGYIVEEINGEYVIVAHPDEEDDAYQIPLGGTARTMTLDFDRARIV